MGENGGREGGDLTPEKFSDHSRGWQHTGKGYLTEETKGLGINAEVLEPQLHLEQIFTKPLLHTRGFFVNISLNSHQGERERERLGMREREERRENRKQSLLLS